MDGYCKGIKRDGDEDIGYLIWRIFRFWQRGKHKLLDEFGLTTSQFEILGAIYHMSEQKIEVSQIILSQETEIDPMTTSTILRNLEKKELILRRESKVDTRVRIVELTDAGRKIFVKAIEKVKRNQEKVFENIDKKILRDQLRILLDELNRLSKNQ
ncbi:MarR family winged helix-turn-helix transcriptional regulator [Dysgonomonas sp. 511]|uniref:MarR family winged helix-turn-helix transcriptional regulator n=1 Tax=Dysgonomonas sp. 511 TaxID=2302930 RepID=UPI0013D6520C|nr:MarR family winged helix-turn-helix transcriptional regulator [Dysgonomonas sp. 511]NDV79058.1 MarR family transcriptional regulator [Dysgonomonas sp. 511]